MPYHRSNPGPGSAPPRYPGSFLLAFREALERLNWQARRWLGEAVECVDAEGHEQVVGLENLYRRVRPEERAAWPELIAGFLATVSAAQLEEPPTDLQAVADRLMVRVGPALRKQPDGLDIWFQPLGATGLGVNLVIDAPQSMSYVSQDMVTSSARPAADWLALAVDNLVRHTPGDCMPVIDADSGLRLCSVGDAYDSSRALILDRLLPETAEHGCFIALPGRDHLVVLPVTPISIAYVHLLKRIAEKYFRTMPYSISEDVFWVWKGQWFSFGIESQGEEISVQPPPEFMEVLTRLSPDRPATSD